MDPSQALEESLAEKLHIEIFNEYLQKFIAESDIQNFTRCMSANGMMLMVESLRVLGLAAANSAPPGVSDEEVIQEVMSYAKDLTSKFPLVLEEILRERISEFRADHPKK